MSENTEVSNTPRIVDPGGEGWAQEPKVTSAELLLYGDRAGVVRLLGQGAVAAGDAYSLACKRAQEPSFVPDKEATKALQEAIQRAWSLYCEALEAHRDEAKAAIEDRRFSHEIDYGTEPRLPDSES